MANTPLAIVILAAGKGTRMKSALPKVMHKIAGLPMLGHVIKTAASLQPEKIVIVAAPDQVETFRKISGTHEIVVQPEQLGTGHAVRCAETALKNFTGNVLVLYGDVPLIRAETLRALLDQKQSHQVALLAFETEHPRGYGRVITSSARAIKIIEEKDTDEQSAKINLCNSGLMAISAPQLWTMLSALKNNNQQKEYYLTDLVETSGDATYLNMADNGWFSNELMGVNDRYQLTDAENAFQTQRRWVAVDGGAILLCNYSVMFSHDTQIGADVTIGANVVFGPGVVIESGAEILPFCHLENCTIKSGARIGPFARIRPGSIIGADARIGNFVEVKNSTIGDGAKANHLSYIGDATVGREANIGAGAITCNYDGIYKHQTEIGRGAFIGSNAALVAPVVIGEGAMIGAGSVITKDVPPGALATARAPQKNIFEWAAKYFAKKGNK